MKKISSALVAANPKKPESERLQREVEDFLLERGVKVSKKRADVLITIGGDGTVLYNKEFTRVPIFGIGSARSFICQATAENWRARLGLLLKGFRVEERSMLACSLNGKKLEEALNEIVVRTSGHRLLTFVLNVQGRQAKFRADGLIFSTPTGSSAYAYSCGGPELPPKSRSYEIVSIAPYRREFEHMVLSDAIPAKALIGSETPAFLAVDGQFIHFFQEKALVKVWKSKRKMLFAAPSGA